MWRRKRHCTGSPASQKWIEGSDHFVLTASLLRHNLMQIHFSPGWHFVTQLQGGSGQPGPGPEMLIIVLLVWCDVWSWATEERCNIAAVSSSPLLSSPQGRHNDNPVLLPPAAALCSVTWSSLTPPTLIWTSISATTSKQLQSCPHSKHWTIICPAAHWIAASSADGKSFEILRSIGNQPFPELWE